MHKLIFWDNDHRIVIFKYNWTSCSSFVNSRDTNLCHIGSFLKNKAFHCKIFTLQGYFETFVCICTQCLQNKIWHSLSYIDLTGSTFLTTDRRMHYLTISIPSHVPRSVSSKTRQMGHCLTTQGSDWLHAFW